MEAVRPPVGWPGYGVSNQRGICSIGMLEQLGEALEGSNCAAFGSGFLFGRQGQAIKNAGELFPAFGTATGRFAQVSGTESFDSSRPRHA